MSDPEIYVVTAEVRRSADAMDVVANEASSSRAAVADSISTQGSPAWKTAGRPGFSKLIDILDTQAARLRADLTDLGDSCARRRMSMSSRITKPVGHWTVRSATTELGCAVALFALVVSAGGR